MNPSWTENRCRPFVKICGVTKTEDALMCYEQGADAIGLLLAKPDKAPKPTSMRLPVENAAEISREVRGKIQTFLLVHTDRIELLESYVELVCPDVLQICADVDAKTLTKLRQRWPNLNFVHSLRVRSETTATELANELQELLKKDVLDGVVLDSAKGGSGKVHDWSISANLTTLFPDIPMLLAGGINSENVSDALRVVDCFGIDVMTSVNSADGRTKDVKKVAALISSTRKPAR